MSRRRAFDEGAEDRFDPYWHTEAAFTSKPAITFSKPAPGAVGIQADPLGDENQYHTQRPGADFVDRSPRKKPLDEGTILP